MKSNEMLNLLPPRAEMERALDAKDTAYDGVFYTAVRTTKAPIPKNTWKRSAKTM